MRQSLVFFILSWATAAFSNSPAVLSQKVQSSILATKAFVEKSPYVDDVELVIGDPFLEIFVNGKAELGCYTHHEYSVEKKENETLIVPRFRSFDIDKKCEAKLEPFREKAADLVVDSPSSSLIKVLGFNGWVIKTFRSDIRPVQQN